MRAGRSNDQVLNTKAQLVAGPLGVDVADDPTYGGMRIVRQGIEVDVVGRPSPALSSAIAKVAKSVPVHRRTVKHSWGALQALTTRLDKDQPTWRARGVLLSIWGPDVASNRVEIWLSTYDAAAASALTTTYGAGWVVVSPVAETAVGS
jgi:hypothetical protein